MAGVINSGQVAAAYTVPDGIGAGLQSLQELALQREQMNWQRKRQQQNDELQGLQIMDNAFKGLDAASGTPFDELAAAQVSKAKTAMMDYMRKNPNASYSDIWTQSNQQTNGIANGLAQAKKVGGLVDEYVKRAGKEYPQIDETQYRNFLLGKAFRDEQGNVMTTPNINFYNGSELQDPELRSQLANPAALAQSVQKELADDYKPTEWLEQMPDGTMVRGKTRPYLTREGQFNLSPVSWDNPDIPVLNRKALLGDAQNTMIPSKQTASGVSTELLQTLKAKPMFADALALERRRIQRDYGDMVKGATKEQLEQLAAGQLLSNYGSRDGVEQPKLDFSIPERRNKLAHQAQMEGIARAGLGLRQASLGIAQQRLGMAKQKAARGQANPLETVPGMIYTARMNPEGQPPEIQAAIKHNANLVNNSREKVNIGGVARVAINLSNMHGQVLHAPGSKQPVSLKLIDMGPGAGEVLAEIPLVYDQINKTWKENMAGASYYGSQVGQLSKEVQAQFPGIKIRQQDPADRLQHYDRQFNNGLKDDYNAEWDEAVSDTPDIYTEEE